MMLLRGRGRSKLRTCEYRARTGCACLIVRARIQFSNSNVVDVDAVITVCMNSTRTKYKSTNTTRSETTGSLFYLYTSQGPGMYKINNRFASSRALIIRKYGSTFYIGIAMVVLPYIPFQISEIFYLLV